MRKITGALLLAFSGLILLPGEGMAATSINLSSQQWLGAFKLDDKQLKAIKEATEKALDAPIDAEQQCAEVAGLCVVRAARQWTVDKDEYREIVIYLHTIGHTSHAVAKNGGKWPEIKIK